MSVERADPDEELIGRVGRGDPAAVQAFVARKLPRILSLAHRMLHDPVEAEDVAQEVFVRSWREAAKWRPGKARFDTWMHRVAMNLCYDRLRRRRETSFAEPPEQVDPSASAERGLQSRQTGEAVNAAIARLPERQREAILLCHYQELGNIEASKVMGVSVEALESLLSRARRGLRTALQDLKP